MALPPDQPITVQRLRGTGQDIGGLFVTATAGGVTVRTEKGEEVVTRPTVRKIRVITPRSKGRRTAAGVVVFGGAMGSLAAFYKLRVDEGPFAMDIKPKTAVIVLSILGASIGAGFLLGRGPGQKTIYEATGK